MRIEGAIVCKRQENRFKILATDIPQEHLDLIKRLFEYLTDDSNLEAEQARRCQEAVTYDYCFRWLRQQKWEYDAGLEACRKHLKFQEKFAIHGRIQQEEVARALTDKKVLLPCCSHKGEPVVVVRTSRHYIGNLEETRKFISYVLDTAVKIAEMSPTSRGKISAIIDLTGLGFVNLDIPALQGIFEMLQSHFPERLGQGLWFVNPPRIFWNAWPMVSQFLAETTRNRINFCTNKSDDAELARLIAPENLPKALGGTARDTLIEEAAAVCNAWWSVDESQGIIPDLTELLQNPEMRPPEDPAAVNQDC